jgi:hypothetical protein
MLVQCLRFLGLRVLSLGVLSLPFEHRLLIYSYTLLSPPPLNRNVLTFEMSSSVMHPGTSVLFAKTSRLAPDSRCISY